MNDRPDIPPSPDRPGASDAFDAEARLCDYLEGDLDPAGRAEVERRLAASPRERALVADLLRQRSALRDLPMPAAPPEVYDDVMNGLERSALLDPGPRDIAGAAVRIRWTRLLAVAAVALLAIGLTLSAVFLLPGRGPNPTVAVSTPKEEATSRKLASVERPKPAPAAGQGQGATGRPRVAFKVKPANVPAPAPTPNAVAFGMAPPPAAIGKVDEPALVLLVSTDDLHAADEQVTTYLAQNRIAFEPEADPRAAGYVFGAGRSSVTMLTKSLGTDLVTRDGLKRSADVDNSRQRQNAQILPQSFYTSGPPATRPAGGGRTIYARQMTLAQTNELADALNAAPASVDNPAVRRGMQAEVAAGPPERRQAKSRSATQRAIPSAVARQYGDAAKDAAAEATRPASRPVDVLIVLQYAPPTPPNSPAAAASTAGPTTAPAAESK